MRELAPSVITRNPCHIPLNQSISKRCSGREEEASGRQIELGSTKHLALEHLEAVDVPFDRPRTPGQRDGGMDGSIVRAEASGKTPDGREGAGGRACHPWCKVRGLALADEGGEVLRECHRLRQARCLLGQLCQRVVLLRCRPFRWAEDQLGRLTGGEPAPWHFRHRG